MADQINWRKLLIGYANNVAEAEGVYFQGLWDIEYTPEEEAAFYEAMAETNCIDSHRDEMLSRANAIRTGKKS